MSNLYGFHDDAAKEVNTMKARALIIGTLVLVCVTGCTSTTKVVNKPGTPTLYVDTRSPGAVQGVGIESQDVTSMTDTVVRDLLASPQISGRTIAPRVVIDAQYFVNESSSRINKNIITNKIRTGLNRAAAGRIAFVERERTDMVERERTLKREGVVDEGTMGTTSGTYGADFRMAGRITSMDAVDPKSGLQQRTHYIFFSLVDLETGEVAWENEYGFGKASADDVIYR
jgi:PBP1b-binding outer membrane lipoprotein LpoB